MNEKELEEFIRKKINLSIPNPPDTSSYDGFDMSGYNDSFLHNMELLSRCKSYMVDNTIDEVRKHTVHFPIFWKGACKIIKLNYYHSTIDDTVENEDWNGGLTTLEIIIKIIKLENPKLIAP